MYFQYTISTATNSHSTASFPIYLATITFSITLIPSIQMIITTCSNLHSPGDCYFLSVMFNSLSMALVRTFFYQTSYLISLLISLRKYFYVDAAELISVVFLDKILLREMNESKRFSCTFICECHAFTGLADLFIHSFYIKF